MADDEQLGDVVRHCWAAERCPDALRARVAEQLAAGRASRAIARRSVWRRAAWPAAAAVVVAVAFGLGLLKGTRFTPIVAVVSAPLPASLETQLIQTHDQCSRGADHQRLPVPRSNGYAIAASLRSRLDRPVLVSQPDDRQWRFAGASVCPVGDVRSAHMVFRRADGDTLSVFSLPRSVAPAASDGQQFRIEGNGHAVVGFVRHGAVYCLVGSGCPGDVSVAKLDALSRQMQRQVVVGDAATAAAQTGELIHRADR